jgi:hypothetical protein
VSPTLAAHGVSLSPPAGFEGRVFRRPAAGEVSASAADGPPAPPGEVPNTVVHVATIALPPDTGDFASGAVGDLGPDDVLLVLFEYDAAVSGTGLFKNAGIPRSVSADDFSPATMQRAIPGQAGCQTFFTEGGRAFCLYAVIGSYARRVTLAAKVTSVLATVEITPLTSSGSRTPPATSSPPATSAPPTTVPPGPTTTAGAPPPSTSTPPTSTTTP